MRNWLTPRRSQPFHAASGSVGGAAPMRVATHPWFSRRDAGDGISHVSEPYVDPFARCNIWIVPGSTQVLVVDTGMGLVSLREAEATLFDRPVTAVATHYHFDHV